MEDKIKCDDCGRQFIPKGNELYCEECMHKEEDYSDCDDDEIVGYACLCCGHTQDSNDWGGKCEMCMAGALDEIYS